MPQPTKVLGHLLKVGQLAPAGQHEGVTDDEPHDQRPGPGKIRCDLRGQQDEQMDDEIHSNPPLNIWRRETAACGFFQSGAREKAAVAAIWS
jgi:hypothetical protein